MSDLVYLTIDLEEITKAKYYDARKDERYVKFSKPHGFYFHRGAQRLVYVTQGGKFYCGKLDPSRDENDLDTFDYLGVQIRPPFCLYKRPQTKNVAVMETATTA
jgi:hypothetical protein